ncbi:DUF7408 domain-containing protein [Paenibacillus spongiae]|uniref:DUF7408 domain-containing protein n=1 Tax=Paenibacillus spongiae TaxID=2909671 RepID=A0ABY5SFN7_9BACL|nr:hypothetical protein [Paenibacillus spongiae]UVI32584.1 hypothetical protein L1F29_12465 [Paenibacillus spongiae]
MLSFRRTTTYVALLVCLLTIWALPIAGMPTGRVYAESNGAKKGIDMQASVGYQGVVKEGRWFPVFFTLTNQTANDISGELVMSVRSQWSGQMINYAVKAQLPKDTPIQLSIALPGMPLAKNNHHIRFYEGSSETGKQIALTGTQSYLTNTMTSNNTIGVLARDPDTLNFMPTLNQRGYNIQVLPIEPNELPEDAQMLDALDMLVLNDVSSDSWSQAQVEAITKWVKRGGTLIAAGGAGFSKTAGPLAELIPVTANGTRTITSTAGLAAASGKPLKLSSPLTVSDGTAKEGSQILLEEEGVPLAVKWPVGTGEVMYVAFDPSLEPMASWSGSPGLWAKLLQHHLQVLQPGVGFVQMGGNSFWELQTVADMFPSIKMPRFSILFYLFLAYLLIVAPLLFIMLKRMDRREWAWWIIPSIAIISSVAIFFIGASDKNSTLTHTVRTVELTGAGDGLQSGVTAVFSPAGGTVNVKFNEAQSLVPYPNDNGFGGSGGGVDDNALQTVYSGSQNAEVKWLEVPFWSTRKTYTDRALVTDTGQIQTVFDSEGQNSKISLTNKTAADMTDVHVLWNGLSYKVGDLKVGSSGSAAVRPKTTPYSGGYVDYASMMFPYPTNGRNDQYARERRLVNAYLNDSTNKGGAMLGSNQPVIIGFTESTQPWFEVNGKQVKSDTLTMWVQRITIDPVKGDRITLPYGMLPPNIKSTTMAQTESRSDGWMALTKGDLLFEYSLPAIQGAAYEKLSIAISTVSGQNQPALSIWNEREGKWAAVTGGGMNWEMKASDYVTAAGTINMKYTVSGDMRVETVMPQIALEGKVKKP